MTNQCRAVPIVRADVDILDNAAAAAVRKMASWDGLKIAAGQFVLEGDAVRFQGIELRGRSIGLRISMVTSFITGS